MDRQQQISVMESPRYTTPRQPTISPKAPAARQLTDPDLGLGKPGGIKAGGHDVGGLHCGKGGQRNTP